MTDDEKDDSLNDELYAEDDYDPDDDGFTIRDRLQAPTALQYTTRDLHTLIHEGIVDLNPPYQRDVVWPEGKQTRLIDSIYRNYYVPPVVFAQVMEEGQPVLRCVDGKQRLTSIQRFFDGQIPYKNPRDGKAYWYTVSETVRNKREVPDYWKDDFAAKKITCIKYETLPPGYERDIFQRVQLGIPLTAAERLQAITSPWADWISELDNRMLSSDTGLQTKIFVDFKRGKNFQDLAYLVYCCEGIPSRVTMTVAKLEAFLLRDDEPQPGFMKEMADVLTTFWHLAHSEDLNRAFVEIPQRVAPLEFIFIGVCLYVLRDCTNKQRAHAIFDMRKRLREKFPDIKNNTKLQEFLWDFISAEVDRLDAGTYLEPSSSAPAKKTAAKKRVRGNDDEDPSYAPNKSKTTPAKRGRGRPRKNV